MKTFSGIILIFTSLVVAREIVPKNGDECMPGGICTVDDPLQKHEIVELLCGNLQVMYDCDEIPEDLK